MIAVLVYPVGRSRLSPNSRESRPAVRAGSQAYGGAAWWAWAQAARRRLTTAGSIMPRPRWVLGDGGVVYAARSRHRATRRVRCGNCPGPTRRQRRAALLSSLPCLEEGRFCALPAPLIRFAHDKRPGRKRLRRRHRREYQPSMFMPQQMVAWPGKPKGCIPRLAFRALLRAVRPRRGCLRHAAVFQRPRNTRPSGWRSSATWE